MDGTCGNIQAPITAYTFAWINTIKTFYYKTCQPLLNTGYLFPTSNRWLINNKIFPLRAQEMTPLETIMLIITHMMKSSYSWRIYRIPILTSCNCFQLANRMKAAISGVSPSKAKRQERGNPASYGPKYWTISSRWTAPMRRRRRRWSLSCMADNMRGSGYQWWVI